MPAVAAVCHGGSKPRLLYHTISVYDPGSVISLERKSDDGSDDMAEERNECARFFLILLYTCMLIFAQSWNDYEN